MAHDGHRAEWNHLTNGASDFWIAKTQVPAAKVLATVWMVSARLDQWPVLGASRFGTAKLATSSSDSLVTLLATCEPVAFDEDNGPIYEFYELMNAVGEPTEDPAVQVLQLRTWLAYRPSPPAAAASTGTRRESRTSTPAAP